MRNTGLEEAQLESRLPREISITSELKSLLIRVKEESVKAG